jgi:signal transduction histidine kinase
VPVDLEAGVEERLSPAVESALYFTVSEALTNVDRYAEASHAVVRLVRQDGAVAVEVCDDGVGGADAARGTGLRGIADRVGALNGSVEVVSPPAGGTTLRVTIPA